MVPAPPLDRLSGNLNHWSAAAGHDSLLFA